MNMRPPIPAAIRSRAFVASGGFTPSDIPQSEADALIAFYNATGGDSWTNNTNWLTDPVVNNWFGITVSGGHVTVIDLDDNNLIGDIEGKFDPTDFSLSYLYLERNASLAGDIGAWSSLPSSRCYLNGTLLTLNLADWAGLTYPSQLFHLDDMDNISGDIFGLQGNKPGQFFFNSNAHGNLTVNFDTWTMSHGKSVVYGYSTPGEGAPVMSACVSLRDVRIQDMGLLLADVGLWIERIYDNRADFTNAAPSLNIGGTNATPGGIYQDATPPTTDLERVYKLANDPDDEGFNTWAIIWNGGSAP